MSKFRNYIRSALFVDFDNIFLSFSSEEPEIATRFATSPEQWLDWIEHKLTTDHIGDEHPSRRVLVRRCYMNPVAFSQYRPFFTRAGFEVIDCPPLTGRGKTSTDIHMVMDILDALDHATHFDEFVILSGDADFTPVLLRLRKHDRVTTVLSAGFASPAYRAAADFLISPEVFIRKGVGYADEEQGSRVAEVHPPGGGNGQVFDERISTRLAAIIQESGPILAVDLPRYFKEIPGFTRDAKWLGYGTLKGLTEALVRQTGQFVITSEDPWRLDLRRSGLAADEQDEDGTPGDETAARELVWRTLHDSPTPLAMPKVADVLIKHFGRQIIDSDWFGKGSFGKLLESMRLEEVRRSVTNPPYLYIPSRHELQVSQGNRDGRLAEDDLFDRIGRITDAPVLTSGQYAVLFEELAREVNHNGFIWNRTAKNVRDHCVEKGVAISRNHVNFVISGLQFVGVTLGESRELLPRLLALKYCENVINLCRMAQLPLSDQDVEKVNEWLCICGGEDGDDSGEGI